MLPFQMDDKADIEMVLCKNPSINCVLPRLIISRNVFLLFQTVLKQGEKFYVNTNFVFWIDHWQYFNLEFLLNTTLKRNRLDFLENISFTCFSMTWDFTQKWYSFAFGTLYFFSGSIYSFLIFLYLKLVVARSLKKTSVKVFLWR